MVTVSCLIVISTLFSQVTTTIPASAEPKIIDIFFFYYIFHLFIVSLHHTVMHATSDGKVKIMNQGKQEDTSYKSNDLEVNPANKSSPDKVFTHRLTPKATLLEISHNLAVTGSANTPRVMRKKPRRYKQDKRPIHPSWDTITALGLTVLDVIAFVAFFIYIFTFRLAYNKQYDLLNNAIVNEQSVQ